MAGEVLEVGGLGMRKNFVPLPYRCVSYQSYDGVMCDAAIADHLMSRELYRRTDIVVLHNDRQEFAVAAVQRAETDELFTHAVAVEVLALPDRCTFIKSPDTDPANRSALAQLAVKLGFGADHTLIVQGEFDHINIIHRPDPFRVRVVEVAPPEPPKLFKMAEHVLSYADLPPICLQLERIELQQLCAKTQAQAYLVPCRCGGLDNLSAPVFFLDERPVTRQPWTLIGCERSLQFHRHYYGDEPPRVDMCPRQLASESTQATLLKCCLLEFDIECDGHTAVVPWGADLNMIESALKWLSQGVDYA